MYLTTIVLLPPEYTKHITALLIEIKRDIYVRRTERCIARGQDGGGRIYTDQRIDMHISIACNRIIQILALKGKEAGILETIRECCLDA